MKKNEITTQRESCLEVLAPYRTDFAIAFEIALENLNTIFDVVPQAYYGRTKATLLHNLIVNEIKERIIPGEKIRFIENYETLLILFDNKVCIRFKKINDMGFSQNHKSDRNDSIIGQQLTINYTEYPEITSLDVGYVIDATWTNYNLIEIVCREHDTILWHSPIISVSNQTTITEVAPAQTEITSKIKITKRKVS